MLRAITISLVALLLISAQALPQTPAAAGTVSLEGIVVRADTGAPVAGAQVTLTFAPAVNLAAGAPIAGGVLGGIVVAPPAANNLVRVQEAGAPPPQQAQPAVLQNALNQALAQAAVRPTFQPVVTNAEGRFAFKDLAAGGYRVAAVADGFVRQEVGQRTVNGQGRPVFVTAGQTLRDASIRLIATGTVSGRVFDENGMPATGAPVQLLRAVYNVQGRNLQSVATGVADDRGDYRAFGVPPGHYYLIAGTPPGGPLGLRGAPGGAGGNARFSLLYYPTAENVDQALTIEVKSGAEAKVDMRLRRQVQTYRVRGRVVDATGAGLPANLQMQLSYRFLNGSGSMGQARAFDPATGTFELQNVAPGEWGVSVSVPTTATDLGLLAGGTIDAAALAARQAQQAQRPTGTAPIRVVDKDLEGVVVTLSTGVTTTGRITVEGQPLSSIPNLAGLRFGATPVVNTINQTPPAVIPPDANGSFQIVGLREMEYRAQFPAGAVPGLYVKSMTYGGEDILNKPLKFTGSGSGTFDIVLRSGAVQVTGSVTDAKSQPVAGNMVVLVPAQRSRGDLFRPGITDQNGRFTVANVPPGEYKLFSWEALDNNAYLDPEVLKQYEQQGKSIQVTESANQTVDVKLIPAP